jgi:hypothetical protein
MINVSEKLHTFCNTGVAGSSETLVIAHGRQQGRCQARNLPLLDFGRRNKNGKKEEIILYVNINTKNENLFQKMYPSILNRKAFNNILNKIYKKYS